MTDLSELPRDQLPSLRDSLLGFLSKYKDGPRAIRIQLCIALAHLAIQMLEWHNVIEYVGSALGNDAGYCILEFLKILPEELNNVTRKIRLSVRAADSSPTFFLVNKRWAGSIHKLSVSNQSCNN